MGMRVGNREFKTKKECKQTVRDLIAEIGMTNDVKSEFLYGGLVLPKNIKSA